jgi:hypothetical protein
MAPPETQWGNLGHAMVYLMAFNYCGSRLLQAILGAVQ